MRTPFAWGSNDCVSFACDAAQALTGEDYRARLGVRWRSARSAATALEARGGLKAATDQVLRRVARAKAHRGDIGLVIIEGRQSLVVIEGELVVGPGAEGLVRLPRAVLQRAWRVA